MRKYASSRVKRKSFYRKSELQMFLLISDGLIGVSTSPYWKVRETFPQITQKLYVGHKDLRLGKIVYILVFYNISFSWLLPLDGFQFIFSLRDSENDLFQEETWAEIKSNQI